MYKISGVSGKMTTETASEDDNFGTEASSTIITKVILYIFIFIPSFVHPFVFQFLFVYFFNYLSVSLFICPFFDFVNLFIYCSFIFK